MNRMSYVACFVQIAQASQTQRNITVLSEYKIIGQQEHKNSVLLTAQSSVKSRQSKQASAQHIYILKKKGGGEIQWL